MRRVVGAVLVALGAFLLLTAVLLPVYVAPSLVRIPLDRNPTTYATATGATVFDQGKLAERTGVDIVASRSVRVDVDDSTRDRVVWDVGLTLTEKGAPVAPVSLDRVAVDRRKATAVDCCRQTVDGKEVRHSGLAYTFPLGAEKKSYPFFDITARRPVQARYIGTESLKGLDVYKYQMTIDPVKIAEVAVPGSLVGSTEPSVTVDRYYANTRTLWVEPTTGVIVKGQEEQLQTLRDPAGTDRIRLLEATLTFDDATQNSQAKSAKDGISRIRLIGTILPIVAAVLGLVLLAGGAFLLFRRSGPTPAHRRGDTPVGAGTHSE